jgi:signal transduction histidine kinase
VILRNLLSNAVAAGARHVHASATQSASGVGVVMDDDGVGVGATAGYTAGSGVGLRLIQRLAARHGGTLELAPRPAGGTRATLRFQEAQR